MCLQLSVPAQSSPGCGHEHLSRPVLGDVDAPAGLRHAPAAESPMECSFLSLSLWGVGGWGGWGGEVLSLPWNLGA